MDVPSTCSLKKPSVIHLVMVEEHVPRKTKVNYALGGFANTILNGLPFANLTFFYEEKLGLSPNLVGIVWLVFAFWNTFNDPLISYVIDNTRTKIGRRIPYIRYGCVFYALAFLFCWFPIAAPGDQVGLFVNMLVALFLLDTMFTFVGCCFFSLPNEIAVTAKERASLSVYSSVFGFASMALGLLLPIFLLAGHDGVHPAFGPFMVALGVSCGIILFLTSFGLKENMFAQLQPHEGFVEGLKETLKNKPFWIIMVPAFLLSMLAPLIQTGLLYYIDYVVAGQDIVPLLLAFVIFVIIGLGTFLKLIEKYHAKKAMIIAFLLFTAAFVLMFATGRDALVVMVPVGLLGFAFAGGLVTNGVVMGDAIDNDELITGKRREAVYGGVNALVTKPGVSVANWGFLSIISAFGFVSPVLMDDAYLKQPQPDIAITGILFAITVLPAIGTLLSALAMKSYPLDGPGWIEKKQQVMEIHARKERDFMQGRSTA